ncbi:signal peptidase complex subunit 3B-like isoform X3 [Andrographis paniculata]|uniref:signal peptidase complex subunit 3B-like isoform X3 n=1 Tax=Andrographis paniculata TaxID=175694 RepID=UPI0021E7E85D|nr:signal peptidase complex subunit 3B-like isoform X3 [Andrographis paniculata]
MVGLGMQVDFMVSARYKAQARAMHAHAYRANALFTLSFTILVLMSAMASLTDTFNSPSPTSHVQVLYIHSFQKKLDGNEEVFVFISAEYETPKNALNQVSLWDGVVPSKEQAKFCLRTINEYRFTDQGSNLRGREFSLTLQWHVMPKTGKMFTDRIVATGFQLPLDYK